MLLNMALLAISKGEENEDTIMLKNFQRESERIFNNMLEYNKQINNDENIL
jgi:hypothetical protein